MQLFFPKCLLRKLLFGYVVLQLSQTNSLMADGDVKNRLITGGFLSIRQEYGFIPFQESDKFPAYNMVFSSSLSFNLSGIPIAFDIYHTSNKNVAASQNHVGFRFDADAYRRKVETKQTLEGSKIFTRLDSLNSIKSDCQRKAYRYEYLTDSMKHASVKQPGFKPDFSYTLTDVNHTVATDTVIPAEKETVDFSAYQLMRDSVLQVITIIDDSIAEIKSMIGSIDSASGLQVDSKLPSRTIPQAKFWYNIKSLEVGYAQPDYSQWLIKNSIKGLNIETASSNYFSAFSYGTVIDFNYINQTYSVNSFKNMAGDFEDFVSLSSSTRGRKIIAAQIGFGDKNKSYIAAGLLKGWGLSSYSLFNDQNAADPSHDRNWVGEVEGKLIFGEHKLGFAIANSVLTGPTDQFQTTKNLFTSDNSKAISLSLLDPITKTISVETDVRYVDPYFKSYGMGFLRTDVMSAKIKFDKKFKKVKAGVFYKYEENNLLNILPYKSKSYSAGISGSYKMNRHWTFRGMYSPVFISTKLIELGNTKFKSFNYSFSANFHRNFKSLLWTTNAGVVNTYSLDNISFFRFYNYSFVNTISKDERSLSLSLFYLNTNSSILKTDSYLADVSLSSTILNNNLTANLTGRFSKEKSTFDFGYMAELNYCLSPSITTSLGIEKYTISSFYMEDFFKNSTNHVVYTFEIKYLFNSTGK